MRYKYQESRRTTQGRVSDTEDNEFANLELSSISFASLFEIVVTINNIGPLS